MNNSVSAQAAPLVSVIVPAYNAAHCLEECLDALLAQTLRHIEIIVVNDGSLERTGIIMNVYGARDARIVPVQRKRPGGFAQSVNDGMKKAAGDYIAIIEPERIAKPRMLEIMYNAAASACPDGADIVRAGMDCMLGGENRAELTEADPYIVSGRAFDPAERPYALMQTPAITPALYKRTMLSGYDLFVPAAEDAGARDWPFFLMTTLCAESVCYLTETVIECHADISAPFLSPEDGEDVFALFERIEDLAEMRRSRFSGFRSALDACKAAHFRARYHALPAAERPVFLARMREALHYASYDAFRYNPYISEEDKDFILQAAYAAPLRFALGYGLKTKLKEKVSASAPV